tara:strand:+ start:22225 stop:22656 length:432 start_codon:yes stop_codon:yes gene_type:complete
MTTMAAERRDYTADETTAYEAYLSAVAEHSIVCARPAATTREKMDAALAADRAYKRFCTLAGMETDGVRQLQDVRRIEGLEGEMRQITESVRSAWSMLRAVDAIGVFERLSDGIDRDDHAACCCLLSDAMVVLRQALAAADGV